MVLKIERPPTLTHTVVEAVRESIYRGEIQPGAPLREVPLAESLGVSRITIREALRYLHEEGLVEIYPHRGAFVTRLSPRRAQEVYTFRALVEPYAVRRALDAGAYGEQDLARLEVLALRLDEMVESAGHLYETVKADIEFHHLVCSQSDHGLVLETLEYLQSLTWLFVLHTRIYEAEAYLDAPSHHQIYEAIRTGDPALAEETVRGHIETAGQVLLIQMAAPEQVSH